jgi:hypothetical protein
MKSTRSCSKNQEAEPVSEECRGEEQGRKEQASCSMVADRGETPCLFPIQRCRPEGAHPSERYDDALHVASGLPKAVRKTATALRKDKVSLRGRRKAKMVELVWAGHPLCSELL